MRFGSGLLLLTAFLGLFGCGGSNSAQLRVLQASPDETTVNVLLDGKTVFPTVGYGSPTPYNSVSSGSRHLQVEPTGTTTAPIDETITVNNGTHYTLITYNFAADILPLLLTDNTTAPSSGDFQLRLVNAAAGAGNVDVYVVSPGVQPGSTPPTITNVGLGGNSNYISFPAGSYEVFFTIAGLPTAILVDTGSVSFSAGQNRTIAGINNQAGGYTSLTLQDLN